MFLKLTYLPSKLGLSGKSLLEEHQISKGKLSITINQNAMENSARIERVAISYPIRKNGNMLQNAITYLKNVRRQGHPVVLCHDWTFKYARHFGCHVLKICHQFSVFHVNKLCTISRCLLARNFTPSALHCIRFRRIFVLHQLLLSTEQFYPTHNILQSSASANKPLCHTFCYPVLYHCCSSISSQGVHSPLKKVFCHGEMFLP